MKTSKGLIYLFISIFLIGCTAPSINIGSNEIKYPKWYLNPTKDTSQTFYATGMGANEQDAINSALNSIASRISVEISSTFESETKNSTMSGYRKTSQKNINSRVDKIKFNNYNIIKKGSSSDRIFLLLKVNKQNLVKGMRENIDLKLNNFDMKLSNLKGSSYKKLKVLREIANLTQNLKTDFLIVNTIISQRDKNAMINKIDSYLNRYLNLKNKITFYIKNINNSPKEYVDTLANIITKKGYNITNSPSSDTVIVNLNVTEYKIITLNKKIIKAKINIVLKDKSCMDNFNLNIAGSSNSSYIVARAIVVKKFAKKVRGALK